MTIDSQLHAAYSIYREFPVSTRLAARSLCFWTQNIVGLKGDYRHRVLPDGCADIVFINDEEPVVVGPWTEPFDVSLIKGTRIFGIRMHPGCAADVLGLPASELLNQSAPLREVCRQLSVRFDQIREPKVGPAEKAVLAEAALTALGPRVTLDRAVMLGIQWIAKHPAGRIGQLSRLVGVGERQLRRRFSIAIGYGPKMFQSVIRFQRLLKTAAETKGAIRLADLAVNVGYADQAHMTREVQRFADGKPTAVLTHAECTLQMSDLFKS